MKIIENVKNMKKSDTWKKRVSLTALAILMATPINIAALKKSIEDEKTSGMKEAEGEPIYYVQDANNEWHNGIALRVFSCEKEDDQTKFLAVLYDVNENEAYFKSLENPESNVVVTFDENGQIAEMQMKNEKHSATEILSMENHELTSSLTYEDVEKLTADLNTELKRK